METSPDTVEELRIKLQSSKKLLASVFDAVAVGIAVLDANGYFVKANQEYCRIYGYLYEELIGKHFTITVLEHQRDFAVNSHKNFIEVGGRMSNEWTVLKKTGELIDIYLQATLLVEDDGQRFKVMSITDITESKKHRQILEKTQDSLNIGGWYYDIQSSKVSWTAEVYRIFDTTTDYVTNIANGFIHYEEPDKTIHATAFNKAIEENIGYQLDLRFISLKGIKKWVHITCNPVAVGGKVVKLYGTIQDITAQKTVVTQLQESQNKYKLLADNLHDVIYTTDEHIKLTFITPSVFRMYGYTADEFMQLDINEYLMPDSIDIAMKSHGQRLDFEAKNPNTTKPYVIISELEAKRKDGTTFWIEVVSTRLYDEQHQKIGFVGIVRDITLRKEQEIELKKLSLVASKTENIIIITNSDRKITWVNEAFVKITGYSFEESIGRNPKFLQGQETNATDVSAITEGLKSKKPFTQEVLNYTKSGEKYWVELNITPIFNDNNEIDTYFSVESDVTARKITEQQLREYAEKQDKLTEDLTNQNNGLRQFSYILSHNIRSYVANILGIIHVMDLAIADKDEQELYLKMIHQSATGLDTVIKDLNDILDIRRPFNKQIEKLSLLEILREATNILKTQIATCNAVVIYDLEIIEIYGVKPYLQSIFYNLISNAIKYRSYDKILEIVITSKIIDNKTIIIIKDNGLGIDLLTQKDNIFSLYKRFHTHTSGKGLGLFMVKTQIEAMGGKISIESAVNQGSVFTIALPHIISQS